MSVKYIMADKILVKPNKDVTDAELDYLYKQSKYLRSINKDNTSILDKIEDVQKSKYVSKKSSYIPRLQPTNTVEYFVEALRNKDFPLVLSLARENNTYKCFLQEYMDEIIACHDKTYDCIQNVIDKMFVKNVKEYNYTCVELLLKIGVNNINKLEKYMDNYNTPIQLWSGYGGQNFVELLINNNADVNVPSESGRGALGQASWAYDIDVINLLLKHGANVNEIDNDNNTPLGMIIYRNNLDLVKLFINKGAKIDIIPRYGNPPLIEASELGYFDIVEFLLEKGANVNISKAGTTALKEASKNNHTEIVELLKKYGAKN